MEFQQCLREGVPALPKLRKLAQAGVPAALRFAVWSSLLSVHVSIPVRYISITCLHVVRGMSLVQTMRLEPGSHRLCGVRFVSLSVLSTVVIMCPPAVLQGAARAHDTVGSDHRRVHQARR